MQEFGAASLFGDHHMHSPEDVRFYTKLKTISSRWPIDRQSEQLARCHCGGRRRVNSQFRE